MSREPGRPVARPDMLAAGSVVCLLLALAACGSGDGEDGDGGDAAPVTVTVTTTAGSAEPTVSGGTPPATPPATTPPTTSAGPPPAAEGSEIAATYGGSGPTGPLPPNSGVTGTAGSGCRPGTSATLPDGIWMTRLVSVTVDGPATAALDLVCFSTVESLQAAGIDRAVEDFAVENDNPLTRSVPLAADVSYYLQQPPPPTVVGQEAQRVAFSSEQRSELQAWLQRIGPVLAWVRVQGGVVTEVYAPPLTTA